TLDRLLGPDTDALHALLLGGPEAVDLLLDRRRHALDFLLGHGAGPRGERDGEAADEQHPAHDGGRIVQTHPEGEPRVGVCPDSGRGLGVRNGGRQRMTTQRPADLEDVIGDVAASYGAGRLIDSLSSAQLPNKRQVIEALNHLKAVMYLGYYATGELHQQKLRYAVSAHLYPAYEILAEQIRRAVSYEGFRSTSAPRDADWPAAATIEFLRKIPRIRSMLSKDVLAAFHGDPAANGVEEVIFGYPSIEAVTVHRIAHELHVQGVPMLPRIMTEHAHSSSGIDIHPGATIGESFFIDHGTGVVIGETSVIGS